MAASTMDKNPVRIWFDAEGDRLEVTFDRKPGYLQETTDERVMKRVDGSGQVLGFSIFPVSALGGKSLDVSL